MSVKGTQSGVGVVSGSVAGRLAGSKVSGDQTKSAIGAIVGGLVGAKAEELVMQDNASEFVIQPDIGEPFISIQVNEENLRSGERVMIINSDKIRIVRDQTSK